MSLELILPLSFIHQVRPLYFKEAKDELSELNKALAAGLRKGEYTGSESIFAFWFLREYGMPIKEEFLYKGIIWPNGSRYTYVAYPDDDNHMVAFKLMVSELLVATESE